MPRFGIPNSPNARPYAPTMLITLTRAPATIGVRLFPAPRMAPPSANCSVRGTIPSRDTCRKIVPIAATSPVPPRKAMRGAATSSPTIVRMTLNAVPSVRPCRSAVAEPNGSRRPVAWATRIVVPIPNALSALIATMMIWRPSPEPASDAEPRRPITATSTRPTLVASNCSTTTGHASRITSPRSARSPSIAPSAHLFVGRPGVRRSIVAADAWD